LLPSGQLLPQTDQRLAGNRVIADRLVSFSDPDTSSIGQRNRRSPTEFGHKLSLAEDQRGLVADTSLRRQRKPA
jgi:transposase, IS5 family